MAEEESAGRSRDSLSTEGATVSEAPCASDARALAGPDGGAGAGRLKPDHPQAATIIRITDGSHTENVRPQRSVHFDDRAMAVAKQTAAAVEKTSGSDLSLSGQSSRTGLSSIQTSTSGVGSSLGKPAHAYAPSPALSTFQSAPAAPALWKAATPTGPSADHHQEAGASTSTVDRMRSMGLHYRPEFWVNLPRTSKIYLIQSAINVMLIIALVLMDLSQNHQVCNCGDAYSVEREYIYQCPPALRGSCYWAPQPIYMGLIVFTITAFYTAFTFSALVYENAHGLVASVALLVVLMGLVIFYTAEQNLQNHDLSIAAIVIGAVAGIWCVMLMVLALASYRQMGWRMYSKCAADVRVKDATKLRDLHLMAHRFTTWIKLDIMTILLVTLTTLTVWVELPAFAEGADPSLAIHFVLWPLIGLIINAAWIALCWMAVHKERISLGIYASYGVIVIAAYAIAALAVLIVAFNAAGEALLDLGISEEWHSEIITRGYTSLAFVGVLTACLIGMRVQCWWCMRTIHRRYGLSKKGQFALEEAVPPMMSKKSMLVPPGGREHSSNRLLHPSLTPLMKGAWIGKPSASNQRKKRFFQLSHDGTTLRWAWNKYILMLYVEDVVDDASLMELRLTVTAEPDLVLRFMDMGSYESWRNGLQTLIGLLLGPDGMDASPSTLDRMDTSYWTGVSSKDVKAAPISHPRGAEDHAGPLPDIGRKPINLGQALAEWVGGTGWVGQSRRASVADPEGVHIQVDRDEAGRRLRAGMKMSKSTHSSGAPSLSDESADALETKERPRALRAASAPAEILQKKVELALTEAATRQAEDSTPPERETASSDRNSLAPSPLAPLSPIQEKPEPLQEVRGRDSPESGTSLAKASSFGGFDGQHRRQLTPRKGHPALNGSDTGAGGKDRAMPDASGAAPERQSPIADLAQGETGSSGTTIGGSSTGPGTHTTGVSYPAVGGVSIDQLNPDDSIADQLGLSGRVDDVEPEDLQLGKFLGAGAEGVVFAAWYNDSPVAVKKTNNVSEVQLHVLAGSHDNIVSARGVMLNEHELHLVMEYCPRGTLDTMIHHTMKGGARAGPGWDPVKVLLPMVRGVARGLLHLHKRANPILHRDLKPGNIFVGHGLVMKLGDFGMSRQVQGRATANDPMLKRSFTSGVVGTSVYSAPEVLGGSLDHEVMDSETMLKADVYSFGVSLWEILARKRPFDGLDHFEIQTAWIINPEDMRLPAIKKDSSLEADAAGVMAELSKLVVDCTAFDPGSRPTAKEIVARLKKAGQSSK